jgi:hypothetical protein
MKSFSTSRTWCDTQADFNIGTAYAWDDVVGTAKRAVRKYNEKAKGTPGVLRRIGRAVGNHAQEIQHWSELIPQCEYTCALSGALSFLVNVPSLELFLSFVRV